MADQLFWIVGLNAASYVLMFALTGAFARWSGFAKTSWFVAFFLLMFAYNVGRAYLEGKFVYVIDFVRFGGPGFVLGSVCGVLIGGTMWSKGHRKIRPEPERTYVNMDEVEELQRRAQEAIRRERQENENGKR